MKRKLTSILLMSALVLGGASTFVSCKDYDGDQVAENNAKLAGLMGDLNNLKTDLEGLKGQVNGNTSAIESINGAIDDINDVLAGHDEKLAEILVDIEDINDALAECKEFKGDLLEHCGGDIGNLITRAYLQGDEFPVDVFNALNKILAQANIEEFGSLQELFDYLTVYNIPEELKNLSDSCAMLAGRDSLLNSRIDSLVTGVNLDMVSNPIYGTFNTPFGVKNYVLAGFVGGEIAAKDFAGETVSGLAVSANGGSIYLTVNPAEVDATGWNVGKLVGRDGEFAKGYGDLILKSDNTPVTTTKAVKLGGYVATPELGEDAASAKVHINKDELKDVAKNVLARLKGQEGFDVTNAVRTVYNTFADAIDQYYAVRCEVKRPDAFGEMVTRTIVSDYNIAAITIKPLAYTTNFGAVGQKVNFKSIPAFEDLKEKLGFTVPTINIPEIEEMEDITVPVMTYVVAESNVVIDETDETKKTATIKHDGDKILTLGFTSKKSVTVDGVNCIEFTVEGKASVNEVIAQINTALEDLGEINNTLNDVNEAIAKAGDYYDKAAKVINKFIGKANYMLDNANQMLQPIMIAGGKDNAFRLSEVEEAPSLASTTSIALMPTSYTLDLLAPAFKKSVKVNGTEINAGLDGGVKFLTATLDASKTNEIVYSAMDFYGNVKTKKYYVVVK